MHAAAPVHARVMHASLAHVRAVPRQLPAAHTSVCVHGWLSSQRVAVRHCHTPPSLVQWKLCPPHITV